MGGISLATAASAGMTALNLMNNASADKQKMKYMEANQQPPSNSEWPKKLMKTLPKIISNISRNTKTCAAAATAIYCRLLSRPPEKSSNKEK